ncbi:MAG: voltage-gated potassium channel [Bacteroidales bacterium]|jgi:voltage-gated potassium channel|nr:voltage-gated potassium channel [Bacteroidales bacterium]NLH51404.1 ion transporter [Bacteroidales bacterium]NPV37535.1 ion transporter [Bacteroidales bacterium]
MKKYLFNLLLASKKKGDSAWYFNMFIIVLILLNIISIELESVESIRLLAPQVFYYFEVFSVIVFTLEYILRVWTADLLPKYKKAIVGNLRYIISPLALIDLLSVLPFYLPFIGVDLRLLRILRIFRFFRLLKIARYIDALSLISKVFRKRKEELIISLIIIVMTLVISSTLMYYAENPAQPQLFSSIPKTMWWAAATITTVGYGDIYPITPLGQFLGSIIAIIGIVLFALPTGIFASGFLEEITHKNNSDDVCPTCGQKIKNSNT